MKKRFLSWFRFIKKQGSSAFFSGNISRSFIYPSPNNSEQKFQTKKKKCLFQDYKVPSYLHGKVRKLVFRGPSEKLLVKLT